MKGRNGLAEGQWGQQQNLERLSVKSTKSDGMSLLEREVAPEKPPSRNNPGTEKKWIDPYRLFNYSSYCVDESP